MAKEKKTTEQKEVIKYLREFNLASLMISFSGSVIICLFTMFVIELKTIPSIIITFIVALIGVKITKRFFPVMSDEQYHNLVLGKTASSREKAIKALGLDESQVKEIEPVNLHGYDFSECDYAKQKEGIKKGQQKSYVSSHFEDTWIFFSDTQVFVYVYSFHLNKELKRENTYKYMYKEITSFAVRTDTSVMKVLVRCENWYGEDGKKKRDVPQTKFILNAPGGSVSVAMENTEENNRKILAMQKKLEEKKI